MVKEKVTMEVDIFADTNASAFLTVHWFNRNPANTGSTKFHVGLESNFIVNNT